MRGGKKKHVCLVVALLAMTVTFCSCIEGCKKVERPGDSQKAVLKVEEQDFGTAPDGKAVKLYYATQASIRPPSFVVYANYPDAIHFSYKRYVENRIREAFGFEGSPLRIFFRKRKRKGN